jgi:hypothetical protein
MSYRDLPGAGPLAVNFAHNTHKTFTQAYGHRLPALLEACHQLGAQSADADFSADLVMRFEALPRLWIYLVFNAADNVLPAQCALSLNLQVTTILSTRHLFALATYLTGRFIEARTDHGKGVRIRS